MLKNEITTTEVIIKHRYCDVCGELMTHNYHCEICGKDLCRKCIGHEDYSFGDYTTVYCNSCWNIGDDYRNKIEVLENEIEQLTDEWHKNCRK